MNRHALQIRILSVFVIAFVCMNAAGIACVAYCQAFEISASNEHHAIAATSGHCNPDHEEPTNENSNSVKVNELDCCPMTVSFFAAPIEKPTFSFDNVSTLPVEKFESAPLQTDGTFRQGYPPTYRGPPIDRRIDRLKNCILRI